MSGTHTMVNIPREVALVIRSRWIDNSTNDRLFADYTIYIPPGNYTYSSMVTFLNTNLPGFSNVPYSNTVYGLGGTAVPVSPPTNQPVSKESVNTRFIFTQFSSILTQLVPIGSPNTHQYTSFEFVNSQEAYRVFVMLGLVPIQNPLQTFFTGSNFVINVRLNSTQIVGFNTQYNYGVLNEIYAPYSFDFSGIKGLYVYCESPVSSQFRAPFTSYGPTNLICRVPIDVIFSQQFQYRPQIVCYTQNRNVVISSMQISCRDDFGETVDFQGLPWFIDIIIKFGQTDETAQSVSGTGGVPKSISESPNVHGSAKSLNTNRDILFGGSQIKPTNKRNRLEYND